MSDETPEPPTDFGPRIAAARTYYGYLKYGNDRSRKNFAADLDTNGVSESSLKAWETGTLPDALKTRGLVARIVELTGLPEDFFYGSSLAVSERLADVERQDRALGAKVDQLIDVLGSVPLNPDDAAAFIRILRENQMRAAEGVGLREIQSRRVLGHSRESA